QVRLLAVRFGKRVSVCASLVVELEQDQLAARGAAPALVLGREGVVDVDHDEEGHGANGVDACAARFWSGGCGGIRIRRAAEGEEREERERDCRENMPDVHG